MQRGLRQHHTRLGVRIASLGSDKMGADPAAKVGLWEGILAEVAGATKSPDSALLMLGRPGIGKRTLMTELLRHACPSAAAADANESEVQGRGVLDYAYFGVRDPEMNDRAAEHQFQCQAACSVLILEDSGHEKLLRSRLTAAKLRFCAAMICLDLKEPWMMLEDLRKWLEVLRNITSELLLELSMNEQDELRTKVTTALEEYKEPQEDGAEEASGDGRGEASSGGGAVSLSYNLALPLVVSVLRADGARALEAQKTIGWAETIEAHLRNECLSYGASIVYTMVQPKNTSNVDLLYEYLMHRLYGYPFKRKAQVPSRDALFIPSGWDSREKVDQAASSLPGGGLDRSFESVVTPPQQQNTAPPQQDECQDMAAFLKQAAAQLQKYGGPSVASSQRSRPTPGVPAPGGEALAALAGKDRQSARMGTSDLQGMGGAKRPSQMPASEGAAGPPGAPGTDNSSLANFFQNLLTRGQGGPGGAGAPGGAPGGAGLPGAGAAGAGRGTGAMANVVRRSMQQQSAVGAMAGSGPLAAAMAGAAAAKPEGAPPAAPAASPGPAPAAAPAAAPTAATAAPPAATTPAPAATPAAAPAAAPAAPQEPAAVPGAEGASENAGG